MTQVLETLTSARRLDENDVRAVVAGAARSLDLEGKRVLLIIPDDTRTCPIGLMIRAIGESFGGPAAALDVLVALGTHRPMPVERIYRINLGYFDPASVDVDSYRGRDGEGILVVDRAGEVLHRLESDRE